MNINELIKMKRKEKNLTQQELANLLFVSSKTISKWETGRGVPEVMMLNNIVTVLNIDPSELLGSIKDTSEKSDFKTDLVIRNSMYISLMILIVSAVLFITGAAKYDVYHEYPLFFMIIGAVGGVFSIIFFFIMLNHQQIKHGIHISLNHENIKRFLYTEYVIFMIAILIEAPTILTYNDLEKIEILFAISAQVIILILIFGVVYQSMFKQKVTK